MHFDGDGKSTAREAGTDAGESSGQERVGPFPTWGWVYGSLIAYGIIMIALLAVLTWVLDPGGTP